MLYIIGMAGHKTSYRLTYRCQASRETENLFGVAKSNQVTATKAENLPPGNQSKARAQIVQNEVQNRLQQQVESTRAARHDLLWNVQYNSGI